MSRKKPQSAMAALLDFSEPTVATLDASEISVTFEQPNSFETFLNTPMQQEGGLIQVDPEDCILWPFADRPQDELGDLDSLAESMQNHGQQEPVLIRANRQNTPQKYEIIFGNRRWRAAKKANIKLSAVFRDITDQQAALCQKEENENRKELSDFARALSYRAQIEGGVFKNENELSKYLGISRQSLNDIMSYLRVPEILRNNIKNYKLLSKNMVVKLATLAKDNEHLDVLMHLADKISEKKITTTNLEGEILRCLSPKTRVSKGENPCYVQKTASGKTLLKTEQKNNGDVFLYIQHGLIGSDDVEEVHLKLAKILEPYGH